MTGKWVGTYKYSTTKDFDYNAVTVQFTIHIDHFDGKNFSGTIRDEDHEFGTKGEGTVEGRIENDHIHFVKKMPIATMRTTEGNRIEFPKKKHRPIYYSGKLNAENDYSGKWKIIKFIHFGFPLYISFGNKGTWELRKSE